MMQHCPPLRPGQYATYVHTFASADEWRAYRLQVLRQREEGIWEIAALVKAAAYEIAILFRVTERDPEEPGEHPVMPERWSTLRGEPGSAEMSQAAAVVMNLLQAGRGAARSGALEQPPVQRELPCELTEAHVFLDPWPEFDYVMEHLVCPRIPITGIARSWVTKNDVGVTLTSFGLLHPQEISEDLRDYSDLDHLRQVDHGPFRLSYPATWLLRKADDEGGLSIWTVESGGGAHTAGLVVYVYGREAWSAEKRAELRSLLRSARPFIDGVIRPKREEPFQVRGGAGTLFMGEMDQKNIGGNALVALVTSADEQTLAVLEARACFLHENPRKKNLPAACARLREILESFELPPDA